MPGTLRDASVLKAVADVIREHVGKAVDSLRVRMDGLMDGVTREIAELRQAVEVRPEKGDKGEPGDSVTVEDVLPILKADVDEYLLSIEPPKDGKSVTADDVLPTLKAEAIEFVAEFLANLKPPKDGRDGVDGKSITVDDVRPLVESVQDKAALDFERRINDLVQHAIDRISTPEDGKDGRDGVDGKDSDPDAVAVRVIERLDLKGQTKADIRALCKELIAAEVATIPIPKDGVDGRDGVDGLDGNDGQPGKDGVDGRDGKDAELISEEQVAAEVEKYLRVNPPKDGERGKDAEVSEEMIAAVVAKHLEANPPKDGEDGTSITADDVMPELRAELQKAIDGIQVPKDGNSVSIEDVMPALADKVEKFLSEIQQPQDGKDGTDGKNGESVTPEQIDALVEKRLSTRVAEWALDFEKRAQDQLQKAVDRIEKPKDGRDGLSFADFKIEMLEDGRTLRHYAERDGHVIESLTRLKHVLDRGVHKEDHEYMEGDGVTWSGSFWIAQKDNPKGRPGQYNRDWRLAVKRGRDGSTK